MRHKTCLIALSLLLCALLIASCAGRELLGGRAAGGRASLPAESGGAGILPAVGATHGRPVPGVLEQQLASELARLGKSASDVTPHAPTGATNAAFDLAASVIDPDGPPDDGGSVYPDPPATTSGAANWRRARVDGKEDGLLNAQDVTPIAVHWGEQSAGYRVYAKLPGETAFHILPNPDDAASPLTIPRTKLFPLGKTQVDSTRPACFNFTYGDDVTALPDGRYEFYTTAYDAATDVDGPASAHIAMDITGGNVNQFPVAKLSLNPDFAGAPAVITLDASLSTDADGSIVEYIWDFDADGITDWRTTDATVPDKSSTGEVDTITPGDPPGPGLPPTTVTVTYKLTAGYADYLYPRVTVVDNKGGKAGRSAKLGVTGWEIVKTLISTKDEFNPPGEELLIWGDCGFEPSSGELVFAGHYLSGFDSNSSPQFEGADMYWRQIAPGDWEYEFIRAPGVPLPDGFAATETENYYLYWDGNGQPMVVMAAVKNTMTSFEVQTYIARRNSAGEWTVSLIYAGTLATPVNGIRGAAPESIVQPAPNELVILEHNCLDGLYTNPYYFDYQYVTYNDGVINVEPVGWPAIDGPQNSSAGMYSNADSEPIFVLGSLKDIDPTGIWWRRRTAPGEWVNERLDHGEYSGLADSISFRDLCIDDAGRLVLGAIFINGDSEDAIDDYFGIVTVDGTSVSYTKIIDTWIFNAFALSKSRWGISVTYNDKPVYPAPGDWNVYHTLLQTDGNLVTERPFVIKSGEDAFASYDKLLDGQDGQLYAVMIVRGGEYPDATVTLFVRRVDPRGTP